MKSRLLLSLDYTACEGGEGTREWFLIKVFQESWGDGTLQSPENVTPVANMLQHMVWFVSAVLFSIHQHLRKEEESLKIRVSEDMTRDCTAVAVLVCIYLWVPNSVAVFHL